MLARDVEQLVVAHGLVPEESAVQVLPRALTRFGLEWDWDGSPALIQSRAVDETGYVQPTYGQLRDARGTNSIYHKNAIHTWRLSPEGDCISVTLDKP